MWEVLVLIEATTLFAKQLMPLTGARAVHARRYLLLVNGVVELPKAT